MKKLLPITLLLIALALSSAAPSAAEVKAWSVDPIHSYVGFKVRHLMVSWVRGQFTDLNGKVSYDPDHPLNTSVDVEIDATSIDTRNERRDTHLRSEDFFDVEKYPKIRFVSKKVEGDLQSGFKVVGDLTIRGVTKEVALDVEGPSGVVSAPRMGERTGVTVSGAINRQDFGLTWNRMLEAGGVTVGDAVIIEIEAELSHGGGGGGQRKRAAN